MTVQIFRELLHRRPFQPFRIVMSSGQTYDVPRPELAFLTQHQLVVGLGDAFRASPTISRCARS